MLSENVWVLLTMLSPVAESRGGIPLGLTYNMSPMLLLVYTILTAFVIHIVYRLTLKCLYGKLLSKWRMFEWLVDNSRKRSELLIRRYGYWGLTLFVAVPLPITGVYTGTLVCWYLDMSWWRAAIAVVAGALMSGVIVLLLGVGAKLL